MIIDITVWRRERTPRPGEPTRRGAITIDFVSGDQPCGWVASSWWPPVLNAAPWSWKQTF